MENKVVLLGGFYFLRAFLVLPTIVIFGFLVCFMVCAHEAMTVM